MRHVRSVLIAAAALFCGAEANAAVVTTVDPTVNTEIGARIRWARTGFEASLWDVDGSATAGNQIDQSTSLNPTGTPVWQLNTAYGFRLTYDASTGTLGLDIDFNDDSAFGTGESMTRATFLSPGMTSFAGYGFNYLSISGNESGNVGRSTLSNLVINGASQSSISPNGNFVEFFFADSSGNPMTSITITGDLTFTTAGTSDERPSWNFNLKGPEAPAPVPLPAAVWLLGSGLIGLVGLSRRRMS